MFRCVKPQRAALIRAAFRLFDSRRGTKKEDTQMCAYSWDPVRESFAFFASQKIYVPLRRAAAGVAHPRRI